MQPGQHRGLGAAQIVAERQRVGTTTQTAVHHLDLARGGGGGSGHWWGHATKITPQSRLRKLGCVIVADQPLAFGGGRGLPWTALSPGDDDPLQLGWFATPPGRASGAKFLLTNTPQRSRST